MHNPAVKKLANEMLTKHGGNRQKAADEMGVTKMSLREMIRSDSALHAVWGRKTKREMNLTAPDGSKVTLALSEDQIAAENEKTFQAIMSPLLSDEDVAKNLALAKMYGNHSELCGSIIGGNVFERTLKLVKQADDVDKDIADMRQMGIDMDTNMRLRTLTEFSINLHKRIESASNMIVQGRVANAKIKALKEAKKSNATGKPGFPVKTAQTNIVAQSVQVNQ